MTNVNAIFRISKWEGMCGKEMGQMGFKEMAFPFPQVELLGFAANMCMQVVGLRGN